LRIIFIKLDTFGPILIAVDIGWYATSQLQPTEDPQQFLSRFWHIGTIFEYIPYLLIPKPSCQSKWESSISVSTFWPACESFIISSCLMFTKLWTPTQQVLCKNYFQKKKKKKKNCFHHFDHLAPISNTVPIWQQPNLLAQPSKVPRASSSPWHSFWQKFISLDNQAPKPNPVLGIPKHPFCEAGHIWTISECCSYPAIHKPPTSTTFTSYWIACSQLWHSCRYKKNEIHF
jgi:hypothetical protein